MANIEELFNGFQKTFENQQEIKDKIWQISKNIDAFTRQMIKLLQIIHQTGNKDEISNAVENCKIILKNDVQKEFGNLEKMLLLVSTAPFNQYHDQWRNVAQKLTFVVALMQFLENGTLALYENVAEALNMKIGENGLELDLEDYLAGLLSLASELSRYAINSVIQGNYENPLKISKFVSELSSGFRLLSFKNDFLRKKFDALKYDVKKIEEVVYDLSIRGIN